jgi:hypothetical protein
MIEMTLEGRHERSRGRRLVAHQLETSARPFALRSNLSTVPLSRAVSADRRTT